ncbi:hypothetical protein LEP1GSC035_4310 [Leptospira noguchii str. 2007001578]|uniref:Uncharacterized protein n=1 Tax=Leptospira noguchii str. 2007001578 TaxID=1049974 RepID=A0ABN0IY67_9LEPT|nr:hypothetical protein LEP1GSC035_4310 [Leptospira noguchii str. 2007001578]
MIQEFKIHNLEKTKPRGDPSPVQKIEKAINEKYIRKIKYNYHLNILKETPPLQSLFITSEAKLVRILKSSQS